MRKFGVAILGLGVVGGGTYEILTQKRDFFKKTQGVDITVECVLEKNKDRAKSLGIDESRIASSIEEVVTNPNVDCVVEVIGGIEPAKTFVTKALRSGKSVVTSNKELFAKHWHELEKEAKAKDVGLYFEASCVGGVPIIRTLQEGMQANDIRSIKGIINGTTNYILTNMESRGLTYDESLKEAQKLGYAEFNPTADVEGFDSTYKLSILSSLAFNTKIFYENVYREGITNVSKEDIAQGKKMGYTLKLLGIGKKTEQGIEVRVHPTFVSSDSMLAQVSDSFNAVLLEGDSVGEILLYGRGAGALPTGSAIVSDVIFAARHQTNYYTCFDNTVKGAQKTKIVSDFNSKYYISLSVKDAPGVLTKISGAFAKANISLKEVSQVSASQNEAMVVVTTHECLESSVKKTLDKLSTLSEVFAVKGCIRIED